MPLGINKTQIDTTQQRDNHRKSKMVWMSYIYRPFIQNNINLVSLF